MLTYVHKRSFLHLYKRVLIPTNRLTADEDSCKRCKTGISAIAADMAHPSVRVRTVNMLKGMAYCGQVNLAFCQELVDTFVPQAMAVMAEELPNNQLQICQAYNNVCQ